MYKSPSESIDSITPSELEEKVTSNEDINLIDVRTRKEYDNGHIPQAKNIPLDEIGSYKGNKDEKLYLICRSGRRSKKAAIELKVRGYNVTNVSGGMLDWEGPVE